MALAACLLGYGEVGRWLAAEAARPGSWVVSEGNPYKAWMDEYAGAGYQGAVREGLGACSRAPHALCGMLTGAGSGAGGVRPRGAAERGAPARVAGHLGALHALREGVLGHVARARFLKASGARRVRSAQSRLSDAERNHCACIGSSMLQVETGLESPRDVPMLTYAAAKTAQCGARSS
jgi:hypothetical protein